MPAGRFLDHLLRFQVFPSRLIAPVRRTSYTGSRNPQSVTSMEAALGCWSRPLMKKSLKNPWKKTLGTAMAIVVVCAMFANSATAQVRTSLDYNEAMFTMMAALNACGYDQDLAESMPLRTAIREEVNRATQGRDAQDALERTCKFYSDHNPGDASRNVAQYVSLGLSLGDAPAFELKVKEADLAPDANY